MQDPRSVRAKGSVSPRAGTGIGRASERELLDRSYLLRRETQFPFPNLLSAPDSIRFRRSRRVCDSFRGNPALSRNGRS